MARYDFRSTRLFLDTPLGAGQRVTLEREQANYLVNVLRLRSGDRVLVFNGRDGEWRAELAQESRKSATLELIELTRAQTEPGDLHYCFAPLKHARLDYMVQKSVELGVTRLQPVMTRHTQAERVNLARMRANAIEAAEQCGILQLPVIGEPVSFDRFMAIRQASRLLVFCDEDAEAPDPVATLTERRDMMAGASALAVLIGPEGGFAEEERTALSRSPNVIRLSLGPRILRADTAAVAALALVQAVLGDWR